MINVQESKTLTAKALCPASIDLKAILHAVEQKIVEAAKQGNSSVSVFIPPASVTTIKLELKEAGYQYHCKTGTDGDGWREGTGNKVFTGEIFISWA